MVPNLWFSWYPALFHLVLLRAEKLTHLLGLVGFVEIYRVWPAPPAVSSKEVARSISNKQPQVFVVFQLYVMEMFVGQCWHEQINLNDTSSLDRVAQGHTWKQPCLCCRRFSDTKDKKHDIEIDTIKVNSGTKSKYTVVASPLSGVFSSSLNLKRCKSKTQPKLQCFGQSLSYDSTIPATQAALNDSVPEVRREAAKDRDWWDSTERGVYVFFFFR